jgi:hypothetical protein
MKIAILFTGRVLNYDTYYKNMQKYIFQEHDVDFFYFHNKNQNEDIAGFVELYKPKIVIDDYIEYNDNIVPRNMNGMYMFFSRYFIFQLFKNYAIDANINYDYVCTCRLDILPLHVIDYASLIQDDNTVNIPDLLHSAGMNDLMAIGNMNAMEKYCNLAEMYVEILKITKNTGSNELILLKYLNKIGLNVKFYKYRCLLRDLIWNKTFNEKITYDINDLLVK